MSKISWGSNRELKKYDYDIKQYYKKLAESWNKLSDHIAEPTDRRTNKYHDYADFFDNLLHMWDMIVQNEQEKNEHIQNLKQELNKWTEQQKGRKSKLTDQKKANIMEWKKEGVSNSEIARRIGISEGSVRNFLRINK